MSSSKAAILTRSLHSRSVAFAIMGLSVIALIAFYYGGHYLRIDGDKGTALPSANEWITSSTADMIAALASMGVSVFLMIAICKIFNVLRSMTWLHVGLFCLMNAATPDLAIQFYTGNMMLPVLQICLLLLLSSYRQANASRHMFLIFLLLSFGTATQYCFLAYTIVFLVGCAQMQVFDGRTLTASLLGLITPWWILFGFGVITPAQVHIPNFTSIFADFNFDDTILLGITVGFTGLLIVMALVLNVFRTIAYNAQARAVNGVFAIMSLITLIACCIDFRNMIVYIPTLNFCASLQVAHYFAVHRADRSFIGIIVIIAIYTAIYLCQNAI